MSPSYDEHHFDTLHSESMTSTGVSRDTNYQPDMLTSAKTGTATMQSRNPFLSQVERDEGEINDEPLLSFDESEVSAQTGHTTQPQTPQQSSSFQSLLSTPTQLHLQPAQGSPGESSGSGQPATRSPKPLPSPPGHRPLPQVQSRNSMTGSGGQERFAALMASPQSHLGTSNSSDLSNSVFSPTTGPSQPPLPSRPGNLRASLLPDEGGSTQGIRSELQDLSFQENGRSQQSQQVPKGQDGQTSMRGRLDVPQHSFDFPTTSEASQLATGDDPLELLKQYDTVFLSEYPGSLSHRKLSWQS
jgi:hypothetical protein